MRSQILSLCIFSLAILYGGAGAVSAGPRSLRPLKAPEHIGRSDLPYRAPGTNGSGIWKDYKGSMPFRQGPDTAILLTDGTVLIADVCYGQWYRLTPDKKGRYEAGKWSTPASLPTGYGPLFFASQVLTDGRVMVSGGEYNGTTGNCSRVWTTKAAIYDPVKNSWSAITAPTGWSSIGDAESVILPDGSYMLADCCTTSEAVASITGTSVAWSSTGSGKADENWEEGWVQLPGGDLLVVDNNTHLDRTNQFEIYDISRGTWSIAGTTAQELVDPDANEIGPAVLRPDGNVIWFGAEPHNDIYNVANGTWTAGPDFTLSGYDCEDAPAVLLPSGNVLVQASPGIFNTPSHFWEFAISRKGKATLTQVDDPKTAPSVSSYYGRFLELPTGQILWTNSGEFARINEVATYTPKGSPKSSWLPVISSVASKLSVGSKNNAISGSNFNGFSQGAVFGDDGQMATNWPLIRIANTATGDVCYARSHDFSTMGVWTLGTTSAAFDIPKHCETGASRLQVVVNGLASAATAVTIK